jgi:hypothetical protein
MTDFFRYLVIAGAAAMGLESSIALAQTGTQAFTPPAVPANIPGAGGQHALS